MPKCTLFDLKKKISDDDTDDDDGDSGDDTGDDWEPHIWALYHIRIFYLF